MRAAWEANSLELLIEDEALYGIPYDWEAPVVGYNPALWEAAGLDPEAPATWTELLEAASQISQTDEAGNLINSGFAFVHNIDVYYQIQGAALLQQAGASVLERGPDRGRDQLAGGAAGLRAVARRDPRVQGDEARASRRRSTRPSSARTASAPATCSSGPTRSWRRRASSTARTSASGGCPRSTTGTPATRSYAWNWTFNARNTPEETVAAHMLADYLSQQGDTFLTQAGLINPRKGWRERLSEEQLAPYTEITESLLDSVPVEPHPKFNEIWAPVIGVFKAVELDAERGHPRHCSRAPRPRSTRSSPPVDPALPHGPLGSRVNRR